MIDKDGNKIKFYIKRLYCENCKRIHHELPDCITPYKRHCTETIEKITTGYSDETQCEERTIRRLLTWWKTILPYFINILKSLTEKYKTIYHNPPDFKETVRAVVNSNNWIFINSICTRSVVSSG